MANGNFERGANVSELGENRRSPNWHGTAKRGNFGCWMKDERMAQELTEETEERRAVLLTIMNR